ncbi:MAG: 3-deoxy-manno-octulosonate cytidylyltransferase [Bacteroidetes bacterium]|nr:3-deoxy-manno-octulosonate cytidylyltransferase [Bacteroidota bacterium]
MKVIAVIPARYAATRFHAKLMQALGKKTVIRHTYDNTVATGLFDEVFLVTDSDIIYNEIISHGGKAIMSKKEHESGSDRIAEAVEQMNVEIIVNVQGDEPFVNTEVLKKLVAVFNDTTGETIQVASIMQPITDESLINNPNVVKVVTDKNGTALYFSRSVIPFPRNKESAVIYYRHIGIYAFRKSALLQFTKWPMGILEQTEKLEQLRYLENGISIKMVETDFTGIGIDSPEDLEAAKKLLSGK